MHILFAGTLLYMAPERIQTKPYSYAADVWSLGLSLLTCALGKFPFPNGKGYWALTHAITTEEPMPLPDHFSDEVKDFLSLCLQKDPARRPPARSLLRLPFFATHGCLQVIIDSHCCVFRSVLHPPHRSHSYVFFVYMMLKCL